MIHIYTECGRHFIIEKAEIARDFANYYATDEDSGHFSQAKYDFSYSNILCDHQQLIDWLKNNMDWYHCETLEELIVPKKKLSELEILEIE